MQKNRLSELSWTCYSVIAALLACPIRDHPGKDVDEARLEMGKIRNLPMRILRITRWGRGE